ncbi:hypothetical protein AS188_01435 [Kocuria flava]|uniref:ABC transporter ATP-binding protein n=1 Tax=Kocuria flava TaxID=446860 RepID=A0A0U3H6Z5_9MICC|nr:ABC transporter ATP-binding protein [Kocuria flava]ALU38629.1 hypothetical protein AS188_01435 [Kocuria flava]GEO91674.1 ABC transporter ATP-binding protein [Kocuria flava]
MTGGLTLRGVSKAVGGTAVLTDVGLAVRPGRVHALLGPNGSGKTTTVRALLGLCRTDAGEILFSGGPLERRHEDGPRLAACFDRLGADRGARVRDVVRLYAAARPRSARLREAVRSHGPIGSLWRRRVAELSFGQRQLLSLCLALATEADLYLLDEPFNGLDVFTKLEVVERIQRLARDGACVLVTSHTLDGFEDVVADVTLLRGGEVLFTGTKEQLLRTAGADELLVRTDDDGHALARLAEAGHRARSAAHGLLVEARTTDEIGHLLSRAGVAVLELRRREPSLQDAFVGLVGARGADGEGGR